MFSFLSKKKSKKKASESIGIQVEPDTDKPSAAWERLSQFHVYNKLPTDLFLQSIPDQNSLRVVCLSDTHGAAENERREYHKRIPDGDILIHCGDFSMGGDPSEILRFNSFMSHLPHPVKLVIAGNHELTFEAYHYGGHPVLLRKQLGLSIQSSDEEVSAACKNLLEDVLYLQDESVTICGIKIYCSPWVPQFGSWGFSIKRGENLLEKWNQIPSDTDILVTHGPPCGYGDMVPGDHHAGCVELLNTVVKRVKPKFHVFGHIHSGYGMFSNGTTTFINSAVCSNKYKPDNDPIIFDIPLPQGYTRSDFAQVSTETLRQAKAVSAETASASEETLNEGSELKMQPVCQALLQNGKIEELASGVSSVTL